MKKVLREIIKDATLFGLPDEHVKEAEDFLAYNEWRLALDTIIIQLYELEIRIDMEFYKKIQKVADDMKMASNEFEYLQELINE